MKSKTIHAAILMALVPFAHAQVPVTLSPDGTRITLSDGFVASCGVHNPAIGLPLNSNVVFRFEPDPQDGRTILSPGVRPYIRINPANLNAKPPYVQRFLVAHECGHINSYPNLSESTANCWAAARLRRLNLFTPGEWQALYQFLLAVFPGPVGPYPSGVDQVRFMNPPFCPAT
jgi:hypothetical protein